MEVVWGCINARGVGCLSKIDGKLNGELCIDLLENSLTPTTHMLTMPDGQIFQYDNTTFHTSRLVKEWFKEEGITFTEWPAQPPNLNPIQNLWDQFKTMVQEENSTNVTKVWSAEKAAWQSFPLDKLIILINSMPRRCKANFSYEKVYSFAILNPL